MGPLLHSAVVASLLLGPAASPPALRARFRRAPPPALLSGIPEPSDAIAAFGEWMEGKCPPGAVMRNYSTAPGIEVQTMEGALAAVWNAVCLNLDPQPGLPSLSVVLLPRVPAVERQEGLIALERHLLACRDCCAAFGRSLALQLLHPSDDAGRDAPMPAFTLTTRVGPPLREEGEELEEEALEEARFALERLIDVDGGEEAAADAPTALEATTAWFALNMPAIFRVVGARQRRRVVTGGAEELYRAFWAEAAILVGEAPLERDDVSTVSPEQPLSSLLVLPGLQQASEFRKLHRSLTLGLVTLGLEDRVGISAFHPADTFRIVEREDGTREWAKSLSHPLLHIVCKVPPAQRIAPRAADTTAGAAAAEAEAAADAPPPTAPKPVVRVYQQGAVGLGPLEGGGRVVRVMVESPPPAGFEWGLSI